MTRLLNQVYTLINDAVAGISTVYNSAAVDDLLDGRIREVVNLSLLGLEIDSAGETKCVGKSAAQIVRQRI